MVGVMKDAEGGSSDAHAGSATEAQAPASSTTLPTVAQAQKKLPSPRLRRIQPV